jgi:tetratricopeptide (TPR) repeat protein
MDPSSFSNYFFLGWSYYYLEDFKNALSALDQISKFTREIGPWKYQPYYDLKVVIYLETGKFRKAKKTLREGIRLFPESIELIRQEVRYSLLWNDTIRANLYLRNFKLRFKTQAIILNPL